MFWASAQDPLQQQKKNQFSADMMEADVAESLAVAQW
jgi:hypothetical protein